MPSTNWKEVISADEAERHERYAMQLRESSAYEDASVVWEEHDAPVVPLARLVFPKADLTIAEARSRSEEIESMSFDPWHCTEDFRPLGEMRRAPWRTSTALSSADHRPSQVCEVSTPSAY